jgi:2-dehydropantoate 2-reductase
LRFAFAGGLPNAKRKHDNGPSSLSSVGTLFVVGAGGIGCAVGYALRAAGRPVSFVDADQDKVAWGRANGVRVGGEPALAADFVRFEDWSPRTGDTVFLCTKCYDNGAVLARLPAGVRLIPIQNGFDPAVAAYGEALEGIASFVSECHPQRTHTRITRAGRLHLGHRLGSGPSDGQTLETARRLVDEFGLAASSAPGRLGIRLEVVPDILPYKYTKLMYNAAISPLAAAAGLDNGRLLSHRPARRLFFALLRENYAILRDAGVPLGKVGPFHPRTVHRILRRSLVANLLAWAFYPGLRGTYCSMSGDLPAGRTEIDYYNGHLIALAAGRPCPLNRRVYALVRRMERERIPPGPERLGELLG